MSSPIQPATDEQVKYALSVAEMIDATDIHPDPVAALIRELGARIEADRERQEEQRRVLHQHMQAASEAGMRMIAAEARVEILARALRCLLGCADHQNPEVWEAAVADAEAALSQTQARGGE